MRQSIGLYEERKDTSETVEELLATEKGNKLVQNVKKAVFDECDRALLEGTASKEKVALQKKHVEAVIALADVFATTASNNGLDISPKQQRIIKIEAILHDALKIVPERELIRGDTEQLEHSGLTSDTRLIMHGEDSAEWATQLLEDLEFNEKLIKKIKKDINTHMPMPYVERALQGHIESTGKNPPIPELDNEDKFPQPDSVEGAILYAADMLSPIVMAGKDMENEPVAGCFDRYLWINLAWVSPGAIGFEKAFELSYKSVQKNVDRLQNPLKPEERGDAAKVEQIIGNSYGEQAIEKFELFQKFIESGVEIDGKRIETLDDITSSHITEDGITMVDAKATMTIYYKVVQAFRKKHDIDTTNIVNL